MELRYRFFVAGRPIPWSVPDVGLVRTRTGKTVRRAKKDANLKTWQDLCGLQARLARGGRPPILGPVMLALDFQRAVPRAPGDSPWSAAVVPRRDGTFVKVGPRTPDLTNLLKAAEDAVAGILFGDDVQVQRTVASRSTRGDADGVWITLYTLDPADLPGDPDDERDLDR